MPNRESDDELIVRALRGVNDCPPLEELERLLEKGRSDAVQLQQHVDGCSHCQTELQMLRSFTSNEVEPQEAQAVATIAARLKSRPSGIVAAHSAVLEHRSWWKSMVAMPWLTPVAAMAALLLVAAGVGLQLRQRQPRLDTHISGPEILRSSSIAILSPIGDVREKPSNILWEAAPNAARYRVRLMEVDRVELWSADTTGARIELPAGAEAFIVPAKTLLIQVAAFDATGTKIAESEPARFRFLQKLYTH